MQWPRRIALTGPQGEQDLSVDSDGPVLARELAEVCRLVACGRRESDLHPLEASLACVLYLHLTLKIVLPVTDVMLYYYHSNRL